MAKKKVARKQSPNMSAEIRSLLEANRKISVNEVMAALQKKFPRASINKNSCTVAFYNARRAMGITRKGRTKRRKPSARAAASQTLDMQTLQQARKFVAEVGDAETALQAVQQLKLLQVR